MNPLPERPCGDCEPSRRDVFRLGAAAILAGSGLPLFATAKDSPKTSSPTSAPETAVKALFDSFTDAQRKEVCFDWDFKNERGLLRTHVSNNWQVTKHTINSPFYNDKQRGIIHDIFKGLVNPEWYDRFLKQLKDDNGGKPWGTFQSVALFGKPGEGKFEFVLTGRHQTLRADGNSEASVAFGGPIFYGHAAETFNESGKHKGNVFWPQAEAANKVYKLLDAKQQAKALLEKSPKESAVAFRGKEKLASIPGLPVGEMTSDQKAEMQKVLQLLIEPFRAEDRAEALAALNTQGGLDLCRLSFFKDEDIDDDGVWDNWRLEGPSFVWYFRGSPHVHVWVNIADDSKVVLNARG